MKEFVISYLIDGVKMVGSGIGKNEKEAIEDFKNFHGDVQIVSVQFYKEHNSIFKA